MPKVGRDGPVKNRFFFFFNAHVEMSGRGIIFLFSTSDVWFQLATFGVFNVSYVGHVFRWAPSEFSKTGF